MYPEIKQKSIEIKSFFDEYSCNRLDISPRRLEEVSRGKKQTEEPNRRDGLFEVFDGKSKPRPTNVSRVRPVAKGCF